jgi:hypothetical protein
MEPLKFKDLPTGGYLVNIWGPTGVGKTVSSLGSLPGRVHWIPTEPRSLTEPIKVVMKEYGRKETDFLISPYTNIMEAIEFLNKLCKGEMKTEYDSLLYDGITYTMGMQLTKEVGEEAYESRAKKADVDRPISSQAKITVENRGTINEYIKRIMNLLGDIAASGKTVVVTCLDSENPKWDRDLKGAPAIFGREIPRLWPGFFDLIGYVHPRVDKDGKNIHPPLVSFEADGSYMAKSTGIMPKKKGPLDFGKILNIQAKKGGVKG